MDDQQRHFIVYVSRKASENRVLPCFRSLDADAIESSRKWLESNSLTPELQQLVEVSSVHVCGSGQSCIDRINELYPSAVQQASPILVLIETPSDDSVVIRDKQNNIPGESLPFSSQSLYGLRLLYSIVHEARFQIKDDYLIPICVIPASPTNSNTTDLIARCLKLGARDVLVTPLTTQSLTTIEVHTLRASTTLEERGDSTTQSCLHGRRRSWVGMLHEPQSFLRESMVSWLLNGIARTGLDMRFRVHEAQIDEGKRAHLLHLVSDWNFSAHQLSEDDLVSCGVVMLEETLKHPDLADFQLHPRGLVEFISATKAAYNQFVPYHNFRHVIDVLQAVYHFLLSMGAVYSSRPPKPAANDVASSLATLSRLIEPVEGLALLVAALGHDVGHPGVNNGFLSTIKAPLAQLYNDRSVLESFHSAAYSQILGVYWPRLAGDARARKTIVNAILSTDMALHFDYVGKLKNLAVEVEENPTCMDSWTVTTMSDRKLLVQAALIKCADISNVVRHYDIAVQWMHLLCDEFSRQAEIERQFKVQTSLASTPSREPLALCYSQLGFMRVCVLPLFTEVCRFLPELRYLGDQLHKNVQLFQEEADLLKARQQQRSPKGAYPFSSVGTGSISGTSGVSYASPILAGVATANLRSNSLPQFSVALPTAAVTAASASSTSLSPPQPGVNHITITHRGRGVSATRSNNSINNRHRGDSPAKVAKLFHNADPFKNAASRSQNSVLAVPRASSRRRPSQTPSPRNLEEMSSTPRSMIQNMAAASDSHETVRLGTSPRSSFQATYTQES